MLRQIYGLTPAEARVAAALAAGDSPVAIAVAAGCTAGTVGQQIKSVLAKTDCHSRADLVSLILTGPAALVR